MLMEKSDKNIRFSIKIYTRFSIFKFYNINSIYIIGIF